MIKNFRQEDGEMETCENFILNIGVDARILDYGFRENVYITPFSPPHLAVIGNSGSGKTYLVTELLGRISKRKECELVLADFKGVDFQYLRGCTNFFQHLDIEQGLAYVYALLNRRMANATPTAYLHPVFFFCDEWAGYLSVLDKKDADIQKKRMSALLMLGRGVSICCVLSLQRADAEYFSKARDNIGHCILLGAPSAESIQMVAASYKNQIKPQPQGNGYLITDGKPLRAIRVPTVRNMEALQHTIQTGLNRSW